MADVVACATALHRRGVALVIVSMGGEGAPFVSEEGALVAHLAAGPIASTVGAGDSSLAGFVLAAASGAEPQEALRQSIRYGAAAASLPGTQAPRPDD
ncbi:PfkB family carbohydrate kinase, partial [Streptococcus suis]